MFAIYLFYTVIMFIHVYSGFTFIITELISTELY